MDLAEELEPAIEDEQIIEEEQLEETQEVVKDEIEEPQETPKEAKAEPEPKEEPKRVPLGELVAERKKRQELERRFNESQEKLDLILNKIREQEEAKSAPPAPEFETDPFGYTLHNQEQTNRRVEQTAKSVEQIQAEINEYKALQQGTQAADYMINEFRKDYGDFDEARQYLMQANIKSLVAQGYDPEEATKALRSREPQVNAHIALNGQNPAQVIYELAQAYGYKPVTAQKESENADIDLNRLEKGQKHAKIGSSGGTSKSSLSEIDSNSGLDEIQAALNDIFG